MNYCNILYFGAKEEFNFGRIALLVSSSTIVE